MKSGVVVSCPTRSGRAALKAGRYPRWVKGLVEFSSLSWLYLASTKLSAVRFHVQSTVPRRYFFASLVPTLGAEVELMLTPSNEVSRERSEALMKWLELGLSVSLPKYSSVVVS